MMAIYLCERSFYPFHSIFSEVNYLHLLGTLTTRLSETGKSFKYSCSSVQK